MCACETGAKLCRTCVCVRVRAPLTVVLSRDALDSAYNPGAHAVQIDAPLAAEKKPRMHGSQAEDAFRPVYLEAVPAAHGVQPVCDWPASSL